MINILPPELRQQIVYSRRNSVLLRYISLTAVVATLLALTVIGSSWYSSRQISQLQQSLADRQKQRGIYKDTEANVQTLQSNLGVIEKLFTEKTQYSAVLADFAAVLPPGSYLNSLTLTGEDKKPLEIIINADSFETASVVRNSLLKSPRLQSADVQSITRDEKTNTYVVDIIVAFKEGQAR